MSVADRFRTKTARQLLAAIAALLLLLGVAVVAGDTDDEQQEGIATACGILDAVTLPAGAAEAVDPYCGHGPDERVGRNLDTAKEQRQEPAPADRLCVGNGRRGYRVRVFYGFPADTTNRWGPSIEAEILAILGEAQNRLDVTHPTHSQRIRFYCGDGDTPRVVPVELSPIGGDGSFDYNDVTEGMQAAAASPDVPTLFRAKADIAVVFMDSDAIASAYPYCGESTVGGGGRRVGGHLAIVGCWGSERTFLHELGHALGAVRPEAPNDSGAYHGIERGDTMSYDDGGPYFRGGGKILERCNDLTRFDCGTDDHWNPDPAAAFGWWNLRDSPFLENPKPKG